MIIQVPARKCLNLVVKISKLVVLQKNAEGSDLDWYHKLQNNSLPHLMRRLACFRGPCAVRGWMPSWKMRRTW